MRFGFDQFFFARVRGWPEETRRQACRGSPGQVRGTPAYHRETKKKRCSRAKTGRQAFARFGLEARLNHRGSS